jgi:putative tryptophan/tyrosine transport system substrate-binding protein
VTRRSRPSNRRRFLVWTGVLLAGSRSAFAQPARTTRVGVLAVPSAAAFAGRTDALRAGLRDFGYVEGRNLLIEFRSGEGRFERMPAMAAELVRLNVDVIVTAGTPAIRAAKAATQKIPIVIAAVGDAVGGGLVDSLARPGGNITGLTYFAPELAAKQLELLKETFPQAARIAFVINPDNPAMLPAQRSVASAAKALAIELETFEVRVPADFDRVLGATAAKGHKVALIIDDPITISNAKLMADAALKHRIATAGFVEYADAGGLLGYGVNLNAMWRRAAFFVDRIVKGATPGEIPVERSTTFDFVINRRTAKAIDARIPAAVLLRADRAID